MSVLIIGEAGVNHNGDLQTALKLCDCAKTAGVDVIKFQTWITDNIITKSVRQADYQAKNTGIIESQYDMLKRLELSFDDFLTIKNYCDKIGIVFASTAGDMESIDRLVNIGIPFIKVSSGDVANVPFLRTVGRKGLPVILSTGMSSLGDIDLSVDTLRSSGADDITLLHCTTNYPCPYQEVNLKAMLTLRDAFKLPVGYSDHTIGTEISVAAVAMGAKVIEKHFTLDRNMEGPDHLASMEPAELGKMVEEIRNVEHALGDGIKRATSSENEIRKVVIKRIVAKRRIDAGEKLSIDNMTVKRSDDGLPARYWDYMDGRIAKTVYNMDQGITLQEANDE